MTLGRIVRALKLERFEPDRIVTSNLVRPLTLAILRAIIFLYSIIVLLSTWITADDAIEYLQYFTHLTYCGLVLYLFCSTVWSVGYLRQPPSQRSSWLHKGSSWWGYAHWLLYSTVITYHIIVPIVYWAFLNTKTTQYSTFAVWQNVSQHAVDGVFALFELIFNRHFLQPIHSVVVAGVMILYMLLTFVIKKTQGIWVYPFLDWNQGPICAVYYIGIAVGMFIVFFILWAIHKYRNRWLQGRSEVVNDDNDNDGSGWGSGNSGGNRNAVAPTIPPLQPRDEEMAIPELRK